MRIPYIWDTPKDKVAFIGLVVIPVVLAILISLTGCTIEQKQQVDPNIVSVDKHDLYELTYEWAMYKEVAILAIAKIHKCSREDAAAHLDNSFKYSNAKKFIADVEFNEKWERKK